MNENTLGQLHHEQTVNSSSQAGGCPPLVRKMEQPKWYAMRSAYCREMKARELLQNEGIECYVPVKVVKVERSGTEVTKNVPLIHNLIFVRTTREKMDPWKQLHEEDASLRYMIDKSTRRPMVVSEKAMDDFIRVTQSSQSDELVVLDHPEVVLEKGQRVEIIEGPFKGVRGHVLRIRRDRRVVVSIEGLLAVAMASMPMNHFQVVEDS